MRISDSSSDVCSSDLLPENIEFYFGDGIAHGGFREWNGRLANTDVGLRTVRIHCCIILPRVKLAAQVQRLPTEPELDPQLMIPSDSGHPDHKVTDRIHRRSLSKAGQNGTEYTRNPRDNRKSAQT